MDKIKNIMAFKKEERIRIHEKYGHKCGYCGEEIELKNMQVDHIIPKSIYIALVKNKRVPSFLTHLNENDCNHFDNLMPTCRVCNNWKSTHNLESFRKELFEQVRRLNDYSSNYRIAKKYGLVQETPHPIVFYFERHT